jgi:N-methylhydantoinase A
MKADVSARFRIGIDIGGTFTDLVLADATGSVRVFKVPTVPADPAQGAFDAVTAAAAGIGCTVEELLARTTLFVHGSTIATNTVLERSGAKVGLLVTDGFRDALEIRRGRRDNPWDHRTPYPPVLVPRYLRCPVGERVDSAGREVRALSEQDIADAVTTFAREGVDAVVVAFFNSFLDDTHEAEAARMLAQHWHGRWVTRSAAIAPVIGEYERTSTAVLNAYIAPRTVTYLHDLDRRLRALGLQRPLLLIQSNGGAISVEQIAERPVTLLLSGPAAGVGALDYYSRAIGSDNLVSMEIGGTSCDVLLMSGGHIGYTDQLSIGGYDVVTRSVDVHSIGAGGGTIARVVEGMLTLGPQGAGAVPGPACYGRGGTHATVTDAQVVLGRLRASSALNTALHIDAALAEAAIRREIAVPLGLSVEAAAAGIVRLMEQKLLHAVQRLSVERGHDPRRFTLVAAGGAGPVHGAEVARQLGCRRVYMPRMAGAFCALGMLHADVRHDYVRMQLGNLDTIDPARIGQTFSALEDEARQTLAAEGFAGDDSGCARLVDLRYASQQWDITVRLAGDGWDPRRIRADFEAEHLRQYGHIQPQGAIEITRQRVTGTGRLPRLQAPALDATDLQPTPAGHRPVWIDPRGGWIDTPVYAGWTLQPGQTIAGPAVVDEHTTTVLIGRGDMLTVDASGNYSISLRLDASAAADSAVAHDSANDISAGAQATGRAAATGAPR